MKNSIVLALLCLVSNGAFAQAVNPVSLTVYKTELANLGKSVLSLLPPTAKLTSEVKPMKFFKQTLALVSLRLSLVAISIYKFRFQRMMANLIAISGARQLMLYGFQST